MPDNQYFMFSKQQMNMVVESAKKTGRLYTPGTVLVMGSIKQFTEILKEPNSRFSDAVVVAKGELDQMRFTEPKIE